MNEKLTPILTVIGIFVLIFAGRVMYENLNPILTVAGILVLVFFGGVIAAFAYCPFKYPYKVFRFDVTGKRNPYVYDYIDRFLNENGIASFQSHLMTVNLWKSECEKKIQSSIFKKRRREQFERTLDDDRMFIFILTRDKTRYTQTNYVRHPYTVKEQENELGCSYKSVFERYKLLKDINFEATLSEYFSKEQRKLMTKELRNKIALRDNFTCQNCGKYMPDGVGLQIDHIVPIAKGGKSIPSNLQVLCSKCNGRKSGK